MSRPPTIAPSYVIAPSHIAFRRASVVFALITRSTIHLAAASPILLNSTLSISTTAESAAVVANQSDDATWAAEIGIVRGDLWGESAYTYADLLWADPGSNAARTEVLDQAKARLEKAIDYAPHQASVCGF